jgi:hypothetical protein
MTGIDELIGAFGKTAVDPMTGLTRRIAEVEIRDTEMDDAEEELAEAPAEDRPAEEEEQSEVETENKHKNVEEPPASNFEPLPSQPSHLPYDPPPGYYDHPECKFSRFLSGFADSLAHTALPTDPKDLQELNTLMSERIAKGLQGKSYDFSSRSDHLYPMLLPAYSPLSHPHYPFWLPNHPANKAIIKACSRQKAVGPIMRSPFAPFIPLPQQNPGPKPVEQKYAHFLNKQGNQLEDEWIPTDNPEELRRLGTWMSGLVLTDSKMWGCNSNWRPTYSPKMHPNYPCWLPEHEVNAIIKLAFRRPSMGSRMTTPVSFWDPSPTSPKGPAYAYPGSVVHSLAMTMGVPAAAVFWFGRPWWKRVSYGGTPAPKPTTSTSTPGISGLAQHYQTLRNPSNGGSPAPRSSTFTSLLSGRSGISTTLDSESVEQTKALVEKAFGK